MRVVYQCEVDPFCQRVLAKHWPHVPRGGAIESIDFTSLGVGTVDLICGGPPCQPASVAGQRKGGADARWLWPEFLRAVRELRPRWVLAENPPGVLSVGHGRWFGEILRELAEGGYDAEWNILSAADMGAPHLRERVWIVAYPRECGQRSIFQYLDWSQLQSPDVGGDGEIRPVADAERGNGAGRATGAIPEPEAAERVQEVNPTGYRSQVLRGTLAYAGGRSDEWWGVEPDVGRVAHGVPARVDRLRSLGNAVVPQCAEYIGRLLMTAAIQDGAR